MNIDPGTSLIVIFVLLAAASIVVGLIQVFRDTREEAEREASFDSDLADDMQDRINEIFLDLELERKIHDVK